MPEPTQTGIIAGAIVVLSTLFGWVFRRQIKRIDNHEKRISEIEQTNLTPEHFDSTIRDLDKSISKVHERVDDVWKKLAEK